MQAKSVTAVQQKAAMSGCSPPEWAVGAKCHALLTAFFCNLTIACTMQVAKHVTAIKQRAAMLGSGPPDWAVGAKCQARAGPEQEGRKAVIEGITPAGNYLVDWLPSARESCFEVGSCCALFILTDAARPP